jgi:hypothetical protein
MKIYRAIEFGKLVYLADEKTTALWNSFTSGQAKHENKQQNWWLNSAFRKQRRIIASEICRRGQEAFFGRSLEYNAMQGGRFNPEKSFGMLYTASSPSVAAMEVIYHLFIDGHPAYRGMKKSRSSLNSCWNMSIPDKAEMLVTVFEIELEDGENFCQECNNEEALRQLCEKVGFRRYLGNNFNRDFIFGNDYEISRILGCHIHTRDDPAFKVASARLSYELQDELELCNVIVPERDLLRRKPKLTGRFREYWCTIEAEPSSDRGHSITMKSSGETDCKVDLLLQKIPHKKATPDQIINYKPDTGTPEERINYSRQVSVQKFLGMEESTDEEPVTEIE